MMVFHDKSLVTLEQLLCIALRVITVHLRHYSFAIDFAGKLQSPLRSLILTPTILKVIMIEFHLFTLTSKSFNANVSVAIQLPSSVQYEETIENQVLNITL